MKRINLNDMNHTIGDDLRLEYDGEPFTGEAVEEAAGLLFAQLFYVDGIRHGSSREWWDDGSLKSEGENFHGRPRGVYREWHRNGRLAGESVFSDAGDLITRSLWDEQGEPIRPRRRPGR
ncbi:toxin-antitoxin system YwqK family antitoxin [Nocardia sp. NPDC003963]